MRVVGRYVIHEEIASGGMAVVHMGRLQGPVGFARTVAIKRLHDSFARDPEFVEMFLDEARIAARIQHPNVVPILDVVATQGELFLVLEYVHGPALTRLLRRTAKAGMQVEPRMAIAIGAAILSGLHAAHEARRESGEPLEIVHRDVNPQNVIVGIDGITRVLDFGIAKASYRYHSTGQGIVKGKLRYMAPEQISGKAVDRRTDIFAASAVIWEVLTGVPFIRGEEPAAILYEIINKARPAPSTLAKGVPAALDRVILRGLAPDPNDRYQTAAEMAADLERSLAPATPREIGEWVTDVCSEWLAALARKKAITEGSVSPLELAPPVPQSLIPGPGSYPRAHSSKHEISVPTAAIAGVVSSNHPPDDQDFARTFVEPMQRRQTMGLIIGSAIGVSLVLGVLAFALIGGQGSRRSADTQTPIPIAVSPSASSSPAQSADTDETDAPATAAVPVEPAPAPCATPSASAPPATTGNKRPPGKLGVPVKAVNCRPPYTIGRDGSKKYKPECL
jgi:serine/threonine-protein kinase